MALTISIDGKGVIANADASPDSAMAGSAWNELGGGTDSFSTDTYLFGDTSFAGAYSAKSGFQYYDIGAGNELDFSGGGAEEGQFIYMPIQCPTIGLLQTLAGKGLAVRIGSSQTDYREYIIAGSDGANGWLGEWKPFVIDPTKPGSVADTGTFNLASIRYIGVWIDTSGLAKGDNIFISQLTVGRGLKITGSSITAWADIIDYCTDYPLRAFVQVMQKEGIGFAYGGFQIGDAAAQAENTVFTSSGSVLQFGKSEYYISGGWESTVPLDAWKIVVEKHASYPTEFENTNTGISGQPAIGMNLNTANATGFVFNGGGFNYAALPLNLNDEFYGTVFTSCPAVKPNGATMEDCTIGTTTEAITGAMELTSASDLNNLTRITFNAYTGKYALYIPASITGTIAISGFLFDGSGTDIYWAGESGTLVVNLVSGSNANTWASAGGTVDIQSSTSLTLTGVQDDTEVRLYTSDLNTEIFGVENTSGGTVIIAYSGTYVDAVLVVHNLQYEYPRTILQLNGVDATLPINQEYDTTYNNPA